MYLLSSLIGKCLVWYQLPLILFGKPIVGSYKRNVYVYMIWLSYSWKGAVNTRKEGRKLKLM